eukprot:GEZU01002093.1.p1 GENE.GEZU01002093.1~~GEZU01002093.1.p1  ORF type:complete len:280 (+),score=90.67 GEZU01002093.1:254-1093(+)
MAAHMPGGIELIISEADPSKGYDSPDDLKKCNSTAQLLNGRMDVRNMGVDGISFDDYLRSLVYQQMTQFQQNLMPAPVDPAVADPGPLGLSAFAVTTLILSTVNSRAVDAVIGGVVLGPAMFYGGLAQLLAGMWEFKRKNMFAATAFTSYGGFWMSFALIQILSRSGIVDFGAQMGDAIGLFLIGYTFFTFYMWIASWKHNWGIISTFSFLLITFILLVIAEYGTISSTAGGVFGIITAACAMYTAASGIINDAYGRTILPLQVDPKKLKLDAILRRDK